ncbi:MAG TPA: hypothetical protein VGM63_06670, partial [Mucilaginibacter sp.]
FELVKDELVKTKNTEKLNLIDDIKKYIAENKFKNEQDTTNNSAEAQVTEPAKPTTAEPKKEAPAPANEENGDTKVGAVNPEPIVSNKDVDAAINSLKSEKKSAQVLEASKNKKTSAENFDVKSYNTWTAVHNKLTGEDNPLIGEGGFDGAKSAPNEVDKAIQQKAKELKAKTNANNTLLKAQKSDIIDQMTEVQEAMLGENVSPEVRKLIKDNNLSHLNEGWEKRVADLGYDVNDKGQVVFHVKDDGIFKIHVDNIPDAIDEVKKQFPDKVPSASKTNTVPTSKRFTEKQIAANRGSLKKSEQNLNMAKENLTEAKRLNDDKMVKVWDEEVKREQRVYDIASGLYPDEENQPDYDHVPAEGTPYYLNLDGKFVKTKGKPMPNEQGLDLFIHDFAEAGGIGYGVTEGKTGLLLAKGKTEEKAVENAKELLNSKTPAEMQAIIKEKYEAGSKSPRSIVHQQPQTRGVESKTGEGNPESADAKDIEVVITEAAAIVRKAKAVSGGNAEPAGVINEIDDSLSEVDKVLSDAGYTDEPVDAESADSDTSGDKEEPQKTKKQKAKERLDAAKKAFFKAHAKARSLLDPEYFQKGFELMQAYAESGYLKFSEIVKDLAGEIGEELRDVFDSLKSAYFSYAALASDEELSEMEDLNEVRRMKVDDFLNETQTGHEDVFPEEQVVKQAEDIQRSLKKNQDLNPMEKDFANVDLSRLTTPELHEYVKLAAILSVDNQNVPTSDINKFFQDVENRMAGSLPPIPPTGENGDGYEGDDKPKGKVPEKEKLPMASTEELPEQTDAEGKPIAKENYSAMGKFKDIRVRNLEQLKEYGKDIGDMSALRDVRQYATSKSQASIVMKTATDRIIKAVGKDGWGVLRQALVESRLRGIQQRWENWATQIRKSSDHDIDDLFEDGKTSLMYDIIAKLDGYEDDPKPEQTILGMITNEQYDDAREYMSEMFANAANNVAFYDKLSNGKTFDEMVQDGKFVDPKMQEAFDAYKSLMAKPFEESHAANEGIFSDALGPLDTYYPLVPTGADKHFVVTPGNKYRAPENPNNKFATGQGDNYSTALSDLSHRLSNAIRSSNKALAINSLERAGLIAKVTKDSPDQGYINVNGQVYTATKALVQDSRMVTANGKTVTLPARYVLMPTWLYKEVKPIFEDTGSLKDDFSLFGRINNLGIKLMLGGPIEATSHSYRLLGGIVNSMPYMQEWAYKNGILGHAGGLALNNPFVKTFAGMGHILFSDISSDEAMETIQEMAKLGIIPEKTWQKTWSKEFAELSGAKKVPIWDFSPILYGKNSIDLKARVLLYRLTKAMNPDATPEQVVSMQNELGNYTISLQGDLEKFVKKHGLAPFYSFGGAIYRSGIKSVFGLSNLPLTRPSLKDAFTSKLGAEQMAKLATYKMAQLLSAGIVGLVGYWALVYHAQTNKWPWEDKSSKLLKIPFPEKAKNPTTKKLWADKKTGQYPDIDFSFFNPFINRGIRATGLPKAYETHQLGGSTGQAIEAGTIQAINTNLSPYTSSP